MTSLTLYTVVATSHFVNSSNAPKVLFENAIIPLSCFFSYILHNCSTAPTRKYIHTQRKEVPNYESDTVFSL